MGDVGFGPENEGDWYQALDYLHRNRRTARDLGRNGRRVVKRYFDRSVVTPQLAEVFRDLV